MRPVRPAVEAAFRGGIAAVVILTASTAASPSGGADEPPGARLPAPRARVPWTSSRVRGTPEPPPPYRTERVFPGLRFKNPVLITSFPGTDRLLVAELAGKIYTFPLDPGRVMLDLFIDVKSVERRMRSVYGLAFHPRFLENGEVIICYVVGQGVPDGTRVSRFRIQPGPVPRCDPESEEVLITWPSGGHNGGCLEFGPDGFLYISTGDGTGPFPPDGRVAGQDLTNLLSAILRIDVDGREGDRGYTVPPDNPFVGREGLRPEIWAYGFRNPWKMSFAPETGDLLLGDVGWDLWEMVYRVERGGNYGWSIREGRQLVHPERQRGPTPILPPLVDHAHYEARSITGGWVYTGDRLPELRGAYIYADYETGKVWGLRHTKDRVTWHREIADSPLKIVAFGQDLAGRLYILDHLQGTVHRLAPEEPRTSRSEFPRRLSETGLFRSVPGGVPAPGVLPYAIRVELWADHAVARRFLALPGESSIRREKSRWRFPEGTVLVKTLSLDRVHGEPASRRRVETQLLHLHDGAWNPYAYEWNEEQSDATLVDASGKEREFVVADPRAPGGKRHQRWHFAGRAECKLCHNVWTGAVLGVDDRQLNRTVPGGGDAENQLHLLERLGTFERPLGKTPDALPRFPRLDEESASLAQRARAYLHVNCSPCHRRNGGGSKVELLHDHSLEKTNTVGAPALLGEFGIDGARIVAPGDPYRSVLLYRMAAQGSARMPRLGSSVVDEDGLRLVEEWIAGLPGSTPGEAETDRRVAARLDDVASLVEFEREAASLDELNAAVGRLLGSTRGALMLARSVDDARLTAPALEALRRRVSDHPGPEVRALLGRFLPGELRRARLGSVVDPATILSLEGDRVRGRTLFFQGAASRCKECHAVAGNGGDFGPDLGAIARKSTKLELLESILEPSKKIDPQYTTYLLQTTRGDVLSGLLVERNAREVVLKEAHDRTTHLAARDVFGLSVQKTSLMPEFLVRDLTAQEVADLLEFLESRD